MKENDLTDELTNIAALDRKLRERLLLARRVEGDRLVLADAVLLAALDGSRALRAGERAALEASPLTTRRLRQLAIERRAAADVAGWKRSGGMLRAADGGGKLDPLVTDDGYWTLHFGGAAGAWVVILQLSAAAPFAPRLMRERPLLRVLDGGGAIILQGRLDADGECESAWRFECAPSVHLQRFGATFAVEPMAPG
jgi:hypothetical protein